MADQAAEILIEHIGLETMDTLIGGRTWWQKRSQGYIAAEWIAAQRDWDPTDEETLKDSKQNNPPSASAARQTLKEQYDSAMDDQICLFYMHGGNATVSCPALYLLDL